MNNALTREQVRLVDQIAIQQFGMSGLVLMENAGANAARLIRTEFGDPGRAVVFCGPGNNGGDGFVIARHLHNAGWSIRIVLAGDPSRMTPDTRCNHDIAHKMGIVIQHSPDAMSQADSANSIKPDEIVVDALLGTGFHGEVREPTASLIQKVNSVKKRSVVGIDVPSGLDCDSGAPTNATVRADLTITFVATKIGFETDQARASLGRVLVAEIGSPRAILSELIKNA